MIVNVIQVKLTLSGYLVVETRHDLKHNTGENPPLENFAIPWEKVCGRPWVAL